MDMIGSEPSVSLLLVGDDLQALSAIAGLLSDMGCAIATTASGPEALREALCREPALIVLDVEMPGMMAFETAELMRQNERLREIPILFLTSTDTHEMVLRRGAILGLVDYLHKPIIPAALQAKVSLHVELFRRHVGLRRALAAPREAEISPPDGARQRQELEEQLVATGRLVPVGTLTALMAHEFNNPLGIIMGFAQELLAEAAPDSPDYRALRIIDEEARRCQRILRQLLQFGRPRDAEFCPTAISQLLEKIVHLNAERLDKEKIEARLAIDHNLPLIAADPQQLEDAFGHLFANAIEAMPKGGSLTVEAFPYGPDQAPQGVVIVIRDSGSGIDSEDLPKIFQPFFSAKKGKGMGLGLAIADRIVQIHGGEITVQSERGKGTSFAVRLPRESQG